MFHVDVFLEGNLCVEVATTIRAGDLDDEAGFGVKGRVIGHDVLVYCLGARRLVTEERIVVGIRVVKVDVYLNILINKT